LPVTPLDDSAPADNIVEEVWLQVLGYLRESWDEFLLPWARKQIPEPPMLPVTTQPDATWTRPPSGPASTEGQLPYLGGSVTWFDPDASST
jgi:hypothetical protein